MMASREELLASTLRGIEASGLASRTRKSLQRQAIQMAMEVPDHAGRETCGESEPLTVVYEEVMNTAQAALGRKVSTAEVQMQLKKCGAGVVSRRVERLARARHVSAHPDVCLVRDVERALANPTSNSLDCAKTETSGFCSHRSSSDGKCSGLDGEESSEGNLTTVPSDPPFEGTPVKAPPLRDPLGASRPEELVALSGDEAAGTASSGATVTGRWRELSEENFMEDLAVVLPKDIAKEKAVVLSENIVKEKADEPSGGNIVKEKAVVLSENIVDRCARCDTPGWALRRWGCACPPSAHERIRQGEIDGHGVRLLTVGDCG